MDKKIFVKGCAYLCLALCFVLSLVACSENSKGGEFTETQNGEITGTQKIEFTETQKEDIKEIVYDIIPKCLFAMTNGTKDDLEFIESSNHVTEEFRENVISTVKERNEKLHSTGKTSAYISATVFTSRPVITDMEFYDYKYENETYSVRVRITLSCTLKEKHFGYSSWEGTPYQGTQMYNCLITWDMDDGYLICSIDPC